MGLREELRAFDRGGDIRVQKRKPHDYKKIFLPRRDDKGLPFIQVVEGRHIVNEYGDEVFKLKQKIEGHALCQGGIGIWSAHFDKGIKIGKVKSDGLMGHAFYRYKDALKRVSEYVARQEHLAEVQFSRVADMKNRLQNLQSRSPNKNICYQNL